MHCNEIRELISCMLDNELTAEESALVTEHVSGCPECMRVFEAFHAVSVTFEEMQEVPVGFTADVMERVHAAATEPKKKKKRILRYVALAACFALVLIGGSRFTSVYRGTVYRSGDTANHTKNETQYNAKHDEEAEQNADNMAVSEQPQTHLSDMFTHGSDDADTAGEPVDGSGTIGTDAVSVSESMTNVLAADCLEATPLPQPAEQTAADLLAAVEDAEPGLYSEPADYTVTLTTENGDIKVSVWIRNSRAYCMDLTANTAWFAAGTPAQLAEIFGPVPTPDTSPYPSVGAEVSSQQ